METLQKFAGMTQPSPPDSRQRNTFPDPPPIPLDDETRSHYSSKRGSRVSLPLNRKPSQKSFRSGKRVGSRGDNESPRHPPESYPPLPTSSQGGDGVQQVRQSHESEHAGASVDDEDFIWGPQHPCFPHPNPHCAPDSEEARTTRVIRVRRDWLQAGDLYPQYANLYPEILDPLVTDDEFRFLVSNINGRLQAMLDPYTTRAWMDAFLGVATGFLWDDAGFTNSKQGMKGLERFVDKWNAERRREGKEVRLVQLRRTGFMSMDFIVPDPGIDVVADDGHGHGDEEGNEGGIGPVE